MEEMDGVHRKSENHKEDNKEKRRTEREKQDKKERRDRYSKGRQLKDRMELRRWRKGREERGIEKKERPESNGKVKMNQLQIRGSFLT